jgi:arsenate reductase
MAHITIWHNPRCSKSREALKLLEERGEAPEIVNYLDETPDAKTLKATLAMLGIGPRDLLRTKEAEYTALGLDDTSLGDDAIIEAMVSHPKLIERPVVIIDNTAMIGRPPEKVLELFS